MIFTPYEQKVIIEQLGEDGLTDYYLEIGAEGLIITTRKGIVEFNATGFKVKINDNP